MQQYAADLKGGNMSKILSKINPAKADLSDAMLNKFSRSTTYDKNNANVTSKSTNAVAPNSDADASEITRGNVDFTDDNRPKINLGYGAAYMGGGYGTSNTINQ